MQRSRNPFYVKSITLRKHRSVTQHPGRAKNNRSHGDAPRSLMTRNDIRMPFGRDYPPQKQPKKAVKRNSRPLAFVAQSWHAWLAEPRAFIACTCTHTQLDGDRTQMRSPSNFLEGEQFEALMPRKALYRVSTN